MARLKNSKDGISRNNPDNAATGNHRHLLHSNRAHAIQ